jgi:hypothetical protein
MTKRIHGTDVLALFIIALLIIITVTGLCSFQTEQSYSITNQYGHEVKIFGSGIYKYDSYNKAPVFIGSDAVMLILVVPLLVISLISEIKKRTVKSKLFLTAMLGVVLYYAGSVSFGVTYNSYQLVYIALFSSSFFAFILSIRNIDLAGLRASQNQSLPTKGVTVFLVASGIALFVAWLPDILGALAAGTTLPLIEVYTTEITYVIDMGIVSPLMFVCLYLLKKKNGLGEVLLAVILMLCTVIGVMLPVQTVFQILAGIETPIPMLITKVAIFVVLALFAFFFNAKLYKNIKIKAETAI